MGEILLPKVWGLLLTPPGIVVVVGLLGLFVTIWRRWIGGILVATSLIGLFVLSVPLVGKRLLMQLEAPFRTSVIAQDRLVPNMQAIVVLGGGRIDGAPEYGEDTVNAMTLERLRYAAHLTQMTGLPLLVSGGSVFGEEQPEAALMQKTLARDFGVKSKWIESTSRNSMENAQHSKKLLAEAGIRRVYLVTHAWHMERAQWSFVEAGLDVVPAPTGFTTIGKSDLSPLGYAPSANGLHASALALRERIGFYWYKSRRDAAAAANAIRSPEPAK
jgi:uncharacterized SAM-binding protein YcdF (DUF218 family)